MIPRGLNPETLGMGELWQAKVAFTKLKGPSVKTIIADLE